MAGMLPDKCVKVIDLVGMVSSYCGMIANYHYAQGDVAEWRRWRDRAARIGTHWNLKAIGIKPQKPDPDLQLNRTNTVDWAWDDLRRTKVWISTDSDKEQE